MLITIRIEYNATMGQVGNVLRSIDSTLGSVATVWASTEDTVEGRYDSEFEPAVGYALIEVEAADRAAAHALVVPAVRTADPQHEVIVGGDLALRPIASH